MNKKMITRIAHKIYLGYSSDAHVGGVGLQIQYTPQHLVRLLQIIVDGNCDMGVRQVASIHFKNFIAKNWSPHEPGTSWLIKILASILNPLLIPAVLILLHVLIPVDEQHKISQADKDVVRDHILVFVTQVPPLLRYFLNVACYYFCCRFSYCSWCAYK